MTHAAKQLAPLTISASDLLSNLAHELERMRVLGMRIEMSLCQLAVTAGADAACIEDVQQFDLLLQQLAALRDFTSAVARLDSCAMQFDVQPALAQITLHDVRVRLAGEAAGASDDGAFVFFDRADGS